MANTHHTGIPKLQWVGSYPPCTPSASISVDLSPFCAGDAVTFTPTLNCVENVIITAYAWVVNGIIKSTSPAPFVTTDLANNDKVYFLFVANENTYVSNVITVVEKTEGCPDLVKYGLLYNWYAATDVRNICADGWEVPELADFSTLSTYLGGDDVSGGKLKEIGFTYWASPNTGATNEVGFNGRASGVRSYDGIFDSITFVCAFFSHNTISTLSGRALSKSHDNLSNAFSPNPFGDIVLTEGRSIRLIKTTTTLTHGQSGTYTGNDGRVYRTICIGTQEWLADNLAETKFRNGDYIHGYEGGSYQAISNAAWANLTDSALCAYNNSWDNV